MARLSIDIGVNLQDSTRQLGKLNSALININKTADDLAKTLKSLGAIKVNPNVKLTQGGSASAPSAPSAPSFNPKQVPDIFADYRSGVIKAANLTEFLEKKLLDLDNETLRLRQSLSANRNDPDAYNQTIQKLKEVEKQTKLTSAALKAQVPATGDAGSGYTRLTQAQEAQRQATNLATLSLTNIGRVAQDLPFGFLGIANNLTPLIEGFAQLRNISVSTGVSMKSALLASLTGPGGLILAFSAVSAALSFASVGLSYWTRKSKEAKEESDKLRDSLQNAAEGAYKTGINLNQLVISAQKYADGSREQTAALNEINKLLGENTEKIDANALANGRAIEITKKFTEALIDKAVAETFVQEAAKESAKIYTEQQKQADIIKKLGKEGAEAAANLAAEFRVGRKTLPQWVDDAEALAKTLKGVKPDEVVLLGDKFLESSYAITDAETSVAKFADSATAARQKFKDAFKDIADKGRVGELRGEIERVTTAIEQLEKPLGKDRAQWIALSSELKRYQDELDKILGKEKRTSRTSKEKLTIEQEYAKAVAEVRADIEKIRDKPFLTIEEKNVAILDRLKSGVDFLSDNFSKQFKLDISAGKGAAEFVSQISKLDFRVFGDKIREAFANAEAEAEATNIAERLLNIDKINKNISTFTSLLDNFYKRQVELSKKPIPFDGLGSAIKTWAILIGSIDETEEALAKLGEEKAFEERVKKIREFGIVIDGLIEKLGLLKQEEKEDGTTIAILRDKVNVQKDIVKAYEEQIDAERKASKGKSTPFIQNLQKELAGAKEELKKLTKQLNFAEAAVELQENLNRAFGDAISGLAEGLGEVLAGGKLGDVLKGVFANLTTSLGKALIQFALSAQAVDKIIKGLEKLIGTAGFGVVFASALALGIGLIAAGKALKFADGGFVSGPGSSRSDSIPARLSNGEYVINAKSVRKYGKGFFDSLNNGVGSIDRMNGKFADGGLVDSFRQFSRNGGAAKALVNRFDTDLLNMDFFNRNGGTSKALVNRPMTATPTNSPYIAETRISGQDLRLVLKRADRQYSNIT